MDPLSIAAGAAGLTGVCVKVAGTLFTFLNDIKNVDSGVSELYEEVLSLSRVLDGVGKAWKQCSQLVIASADPTGDLWVSVKASLDDCHLTLDRLDTKLHEVQKETLFSRGIMRKPAAAMRMNLKSKDIALYRQQLHTYNGAMQSTLIMVNVCLMMHGNTSFDLIFNSLNGLKSQLDRVESLTRPQLVPDTTKLEQQNIDRMIRNIEKLIRAAKGFHSSASSSVAGSIRGSVWSDSVPGRPGTLSRTHSIWGGSIAGLPLNRDQRRYIRDWIPPAVDEESTFNGYSSPIDSSSITSPTLTDTTTISASTKATTVDDEYESDPESDLEKQMMDKAEEMADVELASKNFEKAEKFLLTLLDRSETQGYTSERVYILKTKLVYAYCFQNKWSDAQPIVVDLSAVKARPDPTIAHLLHTLSLQKVEEVMENSESVEAASILESAEVLCKRALVGKRKVYGKRHDAYSESMTLLAKIYDIKGDPVQAEVCRNISHTRSSFEMAPLRYLDLWLPSWDSQKWLAANTIAKSIQISNETSAALGAEKASLENPQSQNPVQNVNVTTVYDLPDVLPNPQRLPEGLGPFAGLPIRRNALITHSSPTHRKKKLNLTVLTKLYSAQQVSATGGPVQELDGFFNEIARTPSVNALRSRSLPYKRTTRHDHSISLFEDPRPHMEQLLIGVSFTSNIVYVHGTLVSRNQPGSNEARSVDPSELDKSFFFQIPLSRPFGKGPLRDFLLPNPSAGGDPSSNLLPRQCPDPSQQPLALFSKEPINMKGVVVSCLRETAKTVSSFLDEQLFLKYIKVSVEWYISIPTEISGGSLTNLWAAIQESHELRPKIFAEYWDTMSRNITLIPRAEATIISHLIDGEFNPSADDVVMTVEYNEHSEIIIASYAMPESTLSRTPLTQMGGISLYDVTKHDVHRQFDEFVRRWIAGARVAMMDLSPDEGNISEGTLPLLLDTELLLLKHLQGEFRNRIAPSFHQNVRSCAFDISSVFTTTDVRDLLTQTSEADIESNFIIWPSGKIASCFKSGVKKICSIVAETIQATKVNGFNIKYLLLSGYLSQYPYLFQEIQRGLNLATYIGASNIMRFNPEKSLSRASLLAGTLPVLQRNHSRTSNAVYFLDGTNDRHSGRESCLIAVHIGERCCDGECRVFKRSTMIEARELWDHDHGAGEPLILEEPIYRRSFAINEWDPRNMVDADFVTRLQFRTIFKSLEQQCSKFYKDGNAYYRLEYELQFKLDGSDWVVTALLNNDRAESCRIPFV